MIVYTCYAGDGRTAIIVANNEAEAREMLKPHYWAWDRDSLDVVDLTKPSVRIEGGS